MPCLEKSNFTGKITWLGRVPPEGKPIRSRAVDEIAVAMGGIEDELHSGATRSSCVRVTMLHTKGTEIRNTRQISILSAEENAEIASEIDVAVLMPEWLGASIVIMGIPDWSHVPPGSRLQCSATKVFQNPRQKSSKLGLFWAGNRLNFRGCFGLEKGARSVEDPALPSRWARGWSG